MYYGICSEICGRRKGVKKIIATEGGVLISVDNMRRDQASTKLPPHAIVVSELCGTENRSSSVVSASL